MIRVNLSISIVFVFFLLICSCKNEPIKSKRLFRPVSATESGIHFQNNLVHNVLNNYNVLAYQFFYRGAGVAVGDINNDGLQDLLFLSNMGENKLYLNEGNFKFKDISTKAKISKKNWSTGAVMVDVNNDGWTDMYICQAGPDKQPGKRQNLLYINNGDLTFTESAQSYGLNDDGISRNAAFFDYDKDGDLDCYVLNESIYHRMPLGKIYELLEEKENLRKCSSKLYQNQGNGKFIEVTEQAGVLNFGYGLSVNVSDLNQDGWLDLYVSNDFTPADFMYINQKDGTFKDEIKERTRNISWASMGMDIADINNDGLSDIFNVEMASKDHFMDKTLMPSMSAELFHFLIDEKGYQRQHKFNSLQLNNGNGTYSNVAGLTGLLKSEWSWATLLADFDNDGYKDCFISNGYRRYYTDNDSQSKLKQVKKANNGNFPHEMRTEYYESLPVKKSKNLSFRNNGNLLFEDSSSDWGLNAESFSNGAAYADLDNDGDLDLLVNNIDAPAFIYENTNGNKNNYIKLKLQSKKASIGTKVYIEYADQKQFQELSPVRGYLSSSDPILNFGLGQNDKIDRIKIIWPDDKYQLIKSPAINQMLIVDHKNANSVFNYNQEKVNTIFKEKNETNLFTHQENEYDDFEKEILLPYKQSTLDPFMSKGDINKDGNDDFYISGAKGQSGAMFVQQDNGEFQKINGPWTNHQMSEDMGSVFFDADNDGDDDLYVISGGNEFGIQDKNLKDRLYINDGKGAFSYQEKNIPFLMDCAMKVENLDIDNDGDQDLFLGGRLIPGKYPYTPNSYVLINDGKGTFTDGSKQWLHKNQKIGLVNDFIWTDLNGDKNLDLIVTGEFMPLRTFINNNNRLEEKTSDFFEDDLNGWWFSLAQADIDNDGDQDLIAGNIGLNSKFKASKKKPFEIFVNDFDGNGTCDIVITKDYKGKKVPLRGRECSSQQMPFIKNKFATYKDFANASLVDILGEKEIKKSEKFTCSTFQTTLFINENGKFIAKDLPPIVQAFPIHAIKIVDINQDSNLDLVLAGNLYNMEVETARIDAGHGLAMLGDGKGKFTPLGVQDSGLFIEGECKSILELTSKTGKKTWAFSVNNGPIKLYKK